MSQSTKILLSMILGVLCGIFLPSFSNLIGFIGDIFIRLLKVLIIPLIFTSISSGIFGLNSVRSLEKLGLKTLLYFSGTTLLAASLGLCLSLILKPGILQVTLSNFEQSVVSNTQMTLQSFVVSVFPANIFKALVDGNLLTIILFSLVFGFALLKLGSDSDPIKTGIESLNKVVMIFVDWVISLSPIGVFCLISPIVAKMGLAVFIPLLKFIFTVLVGIFIFGFIILPLIFWTLSQLNILKFLKYLSYPIMMAFSTASSAATFPILLQNLQKDCDVSQKTSSFVLSLGITLNMNGTALFQACSAVFFAQFYGIQLGITQYLLICLLTLFAAMSAAAIPSAGLVTLSLILSTLNIPIEGIALIIGIDRVLDMFRTTLNIWSNALGCILLDRNLKKS